MYVVIEVPDGQPQEISAMVAFVASSLEQGQRHGQVSPEFRWSIETEVD